MRMCFRSYSPSRVCDATTVKKVWQNVDQSKRKYLIIIILALKLAAAQAAVEDSMK